ncbi:MAG TPA: vWA domain-containing protein, partial [Tepidisphaeraceae bacterium]|nr:vWA domain-containing protein [Tepidisphaeraceae bacterium]
MLAGLPFVFLSVPTLIISAALALLILIITLLRRPDMPRSSQLLIFLGLLLLTLTAGQLSYLQPDPREIVVMVDLSPSTRTAQYRDAKFLQQRIHALLDQTPHRILYFSDDTRTQIPTSDILPDLPSTKTIFNPPPVSAILLFSDARFDLPPTAPPTFIAVDPMLENPPDAAIKQLEIKNQVLSTTISNTSDKIRNLQSPTTRPIPPGAYILTDLLPQNLSLITTKLNPADPWPENDQLTLRFPPPILSERWWIGPNPPPNFKSIQPQDLPTDSSAYLTPSIIILNNLPASALSQTQLDRLEQYTRDLTGSLVLIGGDHAFAAGGYAGTILDSLSPLSSSPPTPTIHWLLLADSSGSMSATIGPATRFDLAKQSLTALLPHLPPQDPISIGSFAENLRWWSTGKSAKETAKISFPQILPTGPTNLEPALLQIISQSQPGIPKELLILTDADTKIENPAALEKGLKEKQIRLHLLLIGQGPTPALPILQQLSQSTGGQILTELSPRQWTAAIQKLFSMISPTRLIPDPIEVQFLNDLKSLPARPVSPSNRTWLKKDATLLAESNNNDKPPLAAQWNFGSGIVTAFSFSANTTEIESLSKLIAQPPRDPRFQITWTPGPTLHIRIDATDNQTYLNNEPLTLTLLDDSPIPKREIKNIPQTSPGPYELSHPAPTTQT